MPDPIRIYTDRSRTISYQECHARRFFNYHFDQTGITSTKLNIPLATGTWTHHGLAVLLQGGDIERAVKEATDGYWAEVKHRGIQVEPGEDAAYVADEQCALVEGMLRAFHIVELPKLLAAHDVIEVEKDECWKMAEWEFPYAHYEEPRNPDELAKFELWFMARLDALLREKESGELYILSFKTAASWDSRREREASHDMQGLSELAAVEYRLHHFWHKIQEFKASPDAAGVPVNTDSFPELGEATIRLLEQAPAPPRIAGVKMMFLLKGDRYADKNFNQRVQRSPLIRGYRNMTAITASDPSDFAWKYSWTDAFGKERRLDYRTWKTFEVWKQPGGVKAWVELLATGNVQPDAGEPLINQFVSPLPYFRHDDDVRDWFEQTIHQERTVAMDVLELQQAIEQYGWASPEVRSLRNRLFPHYRRSCDWPSPCQFIDICYGAAIWENPIESGMYMRREPHHVPEKEQLVQIGAING